MMTVHEVSELTGLTVRTLQYYDRIGLLRPDSYSEAGYRLYDRKSLEKLQQILLFRELEFPLDEIKKIMNSPGFDRDAALTQQIELLRMKKDRISGLIELAERIKTMGVNDMSFKAFDRKKMDEYKKRAKETWGDTAAYKEYEKKSEGRSDTEQAGLNARLMGIFCELGKMKEEDPASEAPQALVKKLQDFITAHFYKCTDEILSGLGKMYGSGGEFTKNIDEAAGEGTAVFAEKAIEAYVKQ